MGDPTVSAPQLWERAILAGWERSQRQLLIERAYGPPRRLTLEPDERPRAVEAWEAAARERY